MTDEQGTLCEISPSVTKYLGIPVSLIQQNQMFLQDNLRIDHLLGLELLAMDELPSKEILTFIRPDFKTDNDKSTSQVTNTTR